VQKKGKKNRGGRRMRRSSTASHCSPQPPLAAPLQPPAPAAPPRCHHRSVFLPSSPSLPASTIHVACEQWRTFFFFDLI
jgi:hypothetical protein